ncbi:Uncharacterised protein [Streptococcus pyogenes]|uniref:hypothetical protein n=1 Tax=Streptococcus pyogenes TaxID=1314 RepID=UPI0010D7D7D0|nr:hypothetical protein [Streptococcus pyogenes]VGR41574.1 hypothetical membrane associated protein [Streptococcus pyogenes]VGX55196.1 Uncharacterised protein [Streptococcus pyogenes]VHA46388.1 Uncharacterised protein [Streptococcus pyogenes]VHE07613.1 Uncharacterised protein [Streptococcus pyogenes]VHH64678.1 Uncharacterised protein [Streptococcus pyogenes]
MKTRSKRFVNLATLCLALLGTTLLMGRPVKAEVISKREYMTRYWEGGSDKYPAYLEARYKGYVKGYNEGLEGQDRPERDNIKVPGDVQFSYDTDYRDGYEEGFGEGQHKRDPLETETEDDSQRSEDRQEGRENEGTASSDLTVEETDDFSVIDEVVDVIYQAVSTIWTYLRGLF